MELLVFLLFVASAIILAWFDMRRWNQNTVQEKNIMDEVRDASFAVVEASLKAEPENWQQQKSQFSDATAWLANAKSKISLWICRGPEKLYLLKQDGSKIHPPQSAKNRLYAAAMTIVNEQAEQKEVADLQEMVGRFEYLVKEDNDNDAQAA